MEEENETEAIFRASLTFFKAIDYFWFVLKHLTIMFMAEDFVEAFLK